MPTTRGKAATLFIFLSFFPLLAFSQTKDTAKKVKLTYAGFYVIGGIDGISYYNNTFFNFVNELNNASVPENISQYQSSANTPISPIITGYRSTATETRLGLGVLFNPGNNTALYHVFEFSVAQNTGNYMYNENYVETANYGNSVVNIHDSTHADYSIAVYTLTYKIQPTYKHFFLSFGINFNFNVLNSTVITNETRKYAIFNTTTGQTTRYTADTGIGYATQQLYVNCPLQLGIGARLKAGAILFEPAFYFTTAFMKGYNIYNVSLSIVKLRD